MASSLSSDHCLHINFLKNINLLCMDYDVLIGYKMKEDFRWNTQDREISFEKENVKEFIFDKFEGLQPADVLKLDLFPDTFQDFCPELQLATLKNSYF